MSCIVVTKSTPTRFHWWLYSRRRKLPGCYSTTVFRSPLSPFLFCCAVSVWETKASFVRSASLEYDSQHLTAVFTGRLDGERPWIDVLSHIFVPTELVDWILSILEPFWSLWSDQYVFFNRSWHVESKGRVNFVGTQTQWTIWWGVPLTCLRLLFPSFFSRKTTTTSALEWPCCGSICGKTSMCNAEPPVDQLEPYRKC